MDQSSITHNNCVLLAVSVRSFCSQSNTLKSNKLLIVWTRERKSTCFICCPLLLLLLPSKKKFSEYGPFAESEIG